MMYMLDTNTCSYIIKNRPVEVLTKFKTLGIDDLCISSITYAELKYWTARNRRLHAKSKNQDTPKINEQIIDGFASHLIILDFDPRAADVYAETRAYVTEKGIGVGNADLLIGSHAISLNLILVTSNTKDFINFPNIRLENWVSS